MAIDINEVYQTVLYVLNKEQRGYIPPAEFNKLAEQSQSIIFEKYFEDLNQALRMPDNDSEYGNRVKTISDKISLFEVDAVLGTADGSATPTGSGNLDLSQLVPKLHRIGTLEYSSSSVYDLPVQLEKMEQHDFNLSNRSKLTAPTSSYPAYVVKDNKITLGPSSLDPDKIKVYYVKRPQQPQWNYTLGQVGNYVFIPTTDTSTNKSIDFEISSIDKVELINTILTYCGIIIRDQQIIQSAASMVMQENQNEKS